MNSPELLECQDCGDVLAELTNELARLVARDPYSFVVYCTDCRDRLRKAGAEAVGRL